MVIWGHATIGTLSLDGTGGGAVDYELPTDKHVTEELRELLGRMLVADPNQRATIIEIERHPWFRKDIPPDLDVSNFNANYLRLSDSAEHANTIRR